MATNGLAGDGHHGSRADDRPGQLLEETAERSQVPKEMNEVLTSLRSLADERLTIYEINYRQAAPLRHLNWRHSCNVTELAVAAGIGLSAMTRLLERLEVKGLLERSRRSSTDRRVVHVSLLEAGATIAELVDEVLVGVEELHLKGFSLRERAQLREFLKRMRVNGRAL